MAEDRLRVATVTTLKAPVDQVLQFTAYHHHLGVDEIILFFDDPTDAAIPLLIDKPGVTVIACDDDHWAKLRGSVPKTVQRRQHANVNWVLRTRRNDLDWLIHIDSDELIYAPRGLHKTLAMEGPGFSALQLATLEAIPPTPDMTDPFREVRLFRKHHENMYRYRKKAAIFGATSGFQKNRFLRGHTKGKPAVRLDGVVTSLSIHLPNEYDEDLFTTAPSKTMRILHYDAGSFDQWYDKWHNRSAFGRSGHKRSRRKQWRKFRKLDEVGDTDGLRALYREYFMIPAWQVPILRGLDLITKLKLPDSWFTWQD